MNLYHSKLGKTLGITVDGECFVVPTTKYKSAIKSEIKALEKSLSSLIEFRRDLHTYVHNKNWNFVEKENYLYYADGFFVQFLVNFYQKKIDELTSKLSFIGVEKSVDNGYNVDLERAKKIPITNYIKFNGGFSPCIFHKEKTGSMKYYQKSNRVHCFGCGKDEDVIGVVQQLHGVGFLQAVRIING